jgi:hypothetical protein
MAPDLLWLVRVSPPRLRFERWATQSLGRRAVDADAK